MSSVVLLTFWCLYSDIYRGLLYVTLLLQLKHSSHLQLRHCCNCDKTELQLRHGIDTLHYYRASHSFVMNTSSMSIVRLSVCLSHSGIVSKRLNIYRRISFTSGYHGRKPDGTKLLCNTNKKSYVSWRIICPLVTLNDLEGHFCYYEPYFIKHGTTDPRCNWTSQIRNSHVHWQWFLSHSCQIWSGSVPGKTLSQLCKNSFIHSFTHSFIHSFIHSSVHSLTHSLIYPQIQDQSKTILVMNSMWTGNTSSDFMT